MRSLSNKMSDPRIEDAKREINKSMRRINISMRMVGLSFEPSKRKSTFLLQKFWFALSMISMSFHLFSDAIYIGIKISNSPRFEDVVPMFHIFGFGIMSYAKVFVLWYKKDVFKQLIDELAEIWPVTPLDDEAQGTKDRSLAALNIVQRYYFSLNVIAVWFFYLTPIIVYLYEGWQGEDAEIGFIWRSWYPFDKHQPVAHVIVYIYEIFVGNQTVFITNGTDLLFIAMASYIGLLLRLLQKRLKSFALTQKTSDEYYQEIVESIKLHQRLIRYCSDLEDAFGPSMLVNYLLSSVNICCVLFVIVLLEPLMAVSNKLFLISALIQMGMICWYGDDILHANFDIAVAAYDSGWYRAEPRSRRALQILMRRAQKPIACTAMKFTNISLATYFSVLTRSYSYFALLYTTYNNH